MTSPTPNLRDIAFPWSASNLPETPFYWYSESRLEEVWSRFQEHIQNQVQVHFAMKANANRGVLGFFKSKGAGLDLVSFGELQHALSMNFPAEKLVLSGVGKSRAELELAIKSKIACINVESAFELKKLSELSKKLGIRSSYGLRLNPDVDAQTHPYISTGLHEHKFGLDAAQAEKLFLDYRNDPWLEAVGVSMHIGSQIHDLSVLREATQKCLDFMQQMAQLGIVLKSLDLGGGLGVSYAADNLCPNFSGYAQIALAAKRDLQDLVGTQAVVRCELGRALCAQSGWLVSRVLGTKSNERKTFVVVDASMTELLRPALYEAEHPLELVSANPSSTARKRQVFDVVGPVCESSDVIRRGVILEEPVEGDILKIGVAGAYGAVMSSNYNLRPLPAEYITKKDGSTVLSRPQVAPELGKE